MEKSAKEIGNIFAINTNESHTTVGRLYTVFMAKLVGKLVGKLMFRNN
jgi:hypothetical protein